MPSQIVQAALIARRNHRWYSLQAVPVFMSPPAALLSGTSVEVLRGGVWTPIETGQPAKADTVAATRPVPVVRWLSEISFFIPRSIREPFFGDLLEDLEDMAAKGHSPASVWWAAISQVAILALRLAWSSRRRC